jgi:uncharacterized membrane protein
MSRNRLALLSALTLSGCGTLETTAPPVTETLSRSAGVSSEELKSGRQLLALRCTSCHSLEPVAKYTPDEWRENVRTMAARAGLSAAEERAITAYLVAARKAQP